MPYADRVHIGGLTEAAETSAEKGLRIFNGKSGALIDDGEVERILSKIAFDAVQLTILLEAQASAVGALSEPWFIECIGVCFRGASARAFQTVEHGAEKKVERRLSGLVRTVEDIQAVAENKASILQGTESADIELTDNHYFCPLSSVVWSSALTP